MCKNLWLRIGLGSIALHLAVMSLLSRAQSSSVTQIVSLPTVELTTTVAPAQQARPERITPIVSGTSVSSEAVDNGNENENLALTYLRDSISRALIANLQLRPAKSELLLMVKFSNAGVLENSSVVRSSGSEEFDREVMQILKSAKLYASDELANLNVQVPIRLK